MDALVGDIALPVRQKTVLLGQVLERPPFQRVPFDIANAAFSFAIVPGRARSNRQNHRPVVDAELPDLGI